MFLNSDFNDLYYKLMTIINDNSRVINKLEASLTDDARVIIYDHHMFIVQATGTLTEREGSVQLTSLH
jgi:nanoRNase/pAp phosphatase (c-di-AMP/oligoRNAs hydrolase)